MIIIEIIIIIIIIIMNAACLALSRLPIPYSIITLIKDFAYYDIEKLAKSRLKLVLESFKNQWEGLPEMPRHSYRPEVFIYWIETDPKCKQYQCEFCLKCGGYVALSSILEKVPDNCECSCFYS